MSLHIRALFDWSLRTRTLSLGRRSLIMGILNVTPDSFSEGGSFATPKAALSHALGMLEAGADILDVGGESTRPNATALFPNDEQARVLPVIEAILKQRPDTVISIDTYHAETARLAVQAGAEIVNDVSGHLWDSNMGPTCGTLGCGAILMHTRGRPSEWRTQPALAASEVVPLVLDELRQRTAGALKAGVAREKIVVDPGFGFGKIRDENYPLLACFSELHVLGYPLLAGLSRKSFLRVQPSTAWRTDTAQEAQGSLLSATLAANTAAILAGAHIVRVHDVAEARASADVADAILSATSSS
jgi:dihydropteroate synthase